MFRIEVEEVIAYSTFDQNKDGLVSQDEVNVSLVHKLNDVFHLNYLLYFYSILWKIKRNLI